MVLIYITVPNKKEAQKISKYLLSKKLCACTNIFPIESFYLWKNKIQNSKEYVVLAKTIDKNYRKIEQEIIKIHSYSTPCVIKIKADANKEYLDWIKNELK